MLDQSGISHNFAKWSNVEMLEQTRDSLSNSQETFVEG